ncbi:MAG: CotH kinase family protein [Bacteroidaceae bacterium]|nr:CotH kinase family protein [Bacteroidaceae bacterium]
MMRFFFALWMLAVPMTLWSDDWSSFDRLIASLRLTSNVEDLSDSVRIQLDEPRMAYANITGISALPNSKQTYREGWMEVYDGEGHYFRKRIRIHGQGGYSIRYAKKNFSCTFCEQDYTEEVTTDLRFGQWVWQDGFHFKAFWTDFSRGLGEMGYKMFSILVADRPGYPARAGVQAARARCFPDGFPCALYMNGRFYGIYAWQLKKHRKNMGMKKTEPMHIHIDGNINNKYLFGGKVDWKQFEVRNPKELFTQSGDEYNGNSPSELMDASSPYYHEANDDEATRLGKERSAQVKQAVLMLASTNATLFAMQSSHASATAIRDVFSHHFDVASLIDYYLFYHLSANGDGSLKNWQWFTYDGRLWMVTPYDLDQTFGINLYGVVRPPTFSVSELTEGPFLWLIDYFQPEIRKRYADLRASGQISAERLVPVVEDWCERVGETFYAMERAAWPQSPCYCDAVCNAPWQPCEEWDLYALVPAYSATALFQAGDICRLEGRLWKTTARVQGVYPFSRNANRDSLERLRAWIPERIPYLDDKFGYKPNAVRPPTSTHTTDGTIRYYTPDGLPISRLRRGVNIIRYGNGSTRKVLIR